MCNKEVLCIFMWSPWVRVKKCVPSVTALMNSFQQSYINHIYHNYVNINTYFTCKISSMYNQNWQNNLQKTYEMSPPWRVPSVTIFKSRSDILVHLFVFKCAYFIMNHARAVIMVSIGSSMIKVHNEKNNIKSESQIYATLAIC